MCSLYHLVNMGLKLQALLKYVPKVRHVYSVCTYYVCTAFRKSRVHDMTTIMTIKVLILCL